MSSDLNAAEGSRWEKIKKDPAPAIGVAGFVGVVGYSAWNYFRRGSEMKPSVYIIQTRVAAQSFVIGLLTATVAYNIYHHIRYDDGKEHPNATNISHFQTPGDGKFHPHANAHHHNNSK